MHTKSARSTNASDSQRFAVLDYVVLEMGWVNKNQAPW